MRTWGPRALHIAQFACHTGHSHPHWQLAAGGRALGVGLAGSWAADCACKAAALAAAAFSCAGSSRP